MPSACFLSPHLDDAAFSAGGTMARLKSAGWHVTMVTVFTRSVPQPLRPFALQCQTDKGLSSEVDYMALRRDEDAAAGRALGLGVDEVIWLDLPEAPHRGYDSAADLFAGIHPDDEATSGRVVEAARRHVAEDVIFTCAGIGRHVDHLHVRAAAEALAGGRQHCSLLFWQDSPYVLRLPQPPTCDITVDITATLAAKLDACAAYASQLGFQFGSEESMRRRLSACMERFIGSPPHTIFEALGCRSHAADKAGLSAQTPPSNS